MAESPSKKARVGELAKFISDTNNAYEKLHLAYEQQFWGTKMNLQQGEVPFSTDLLSSTKAAMEAWLRSPDIKAQTDAFIAAGEGNEEQQKVLACFTRTFGCYQMSDQDAVRLRGECEAVENKLNASRNTELKLGYKDPAAADVFVEKSSVGLRTVMKTSDDEATRKAAWEGLRSIGPFIVSNGFCEMVKLRNQMARKLGYIDFYDYKVTQAEGFGKVQLFEILDTLLSGSEELLSQARARLVREKADAGVDPLAPWNSGWVMAGDVEKQLDPFFPFEKALEMWGRCYAAMGISYQGATMTLDLLDRKGKYSNGFCHWPQPAWQKADGTWQPSTTNFTSLADPAAVGSGKTALTTLMHEAGHAAHFANITQASPLFSQERAPTSVAYAENQSMFLDSLCGDGAWRGRYAKDRSGAALPWELHEAELRATHPYRVFQMRSMLCVPYFEKALYELDEEAVTPAGIQQLADQIEEHVQGSLGARPMLSVPHIISDEASCYYHGYVLAEMSVYQTRKHFLVDQSVPIVDNPAVGRTLTEAYWQPGNSEMFLDLVQALTKKPLTGEAWIADLKEPLESVVESERVEYAAATATVGAAAEDDKVELNMRMIVKDGDELIADSDELGGFLPTCRAFESYVRGRFLDNASRL